jgi:hypothetical protein
LRGTRIKVFRLLVHLIGGNLAGGIEKGGEWSGRCSLEVVDLVLSTCVAGLVSGDMDRLKSSMATTSALWRWSLGARARRLPGCHRQSQAGFHRGAATTVCRRLVLSAIVVVRLSKSLNVIFIILGVICTSCEAL